MAKEWIGPALAAVVLFTLGYAVGAYFTGNSWAVRYSTQTKEYADYRAKAEAASERAKQTAETQTQQWQEQLNGVERNAQQQISDLEQRIADGNATANGLQQKLSDLSARYRRDTAATGECATAETTAGVLAELLAETERLAGIYAATADRAGVAGRACLGAWPKQEKMDDW